ncbi:MAG: hypothetical protein PHW13_02840 [Methylococcales bacterium]|nr:hypothetical protein [Methylococcales bacterium]
MNIPLSGFFRIAVLLSCCLLLSGCDKLGLNQKKTNALGNRPDLDCIIANDFYAVHFSSYLQPVKGEQNADPKAAFVPYCQKIPRPGKMFFTADLIDRDIRTTPIGIRLVEVEKTGQPAPDDIREIRTVAEIPSKLYPRGAVEAQADIDKKGDYILYLLINDAVEEDDKFRIPLEVGVDPNALPLQTIVIAAVAGLLILMLVFLLYLFKFKPKSRS